MCTYFRWLVLALPLSVILLPAPGFGQDSAGYTPGIRFSHALHLTKVGAVCATCHLRILGSTTSADNNLPQEAQCLTCHDGETAPDDCASCHNGVRIPFAIGGHAERERRFRFDHQAHLALDDLAETMALGMAVSDYPDALRYRRDLIDPALVCTACHRGMEQMVTLTADALPIMDDCLLCHSNPVPEETCRTCHPQEVTLKPVSHTFNFIDEHQMTQDFVEGRCFVCHSENYCAECH